MNTPAPTPGRPSPRANRPVARRPRALAAVGFVAMLAGLALPAMAWYPPTVIQETNLALDCSACQKEYRGFAIDSNGNTFVTVDFFLAKFNSAGVREWAHTYGVSRLIRPCGVDVDGDGNVYLIDGYTHIIHKTDNDGVGIVQWQGDPEGYWLGAGFGLRLDEDGSMLVRTHSQTQRMAADGDRAAQWYSGGEYAVALDADRNVYTADNGTIFKTSSDGTMLATFGPTPYPEATFGHPSGLAVDENGFIYVVDGGPYVRVFGPEGTYRVRWLVDNGHLHDIRFVGGHLALLNGGKVDIYTHPGSFPPPPPPPPPSHIIPSHIMLHIAPVVAREQACFNGPSSAADIVTEANASADGTDQYLVYVLGSPRLGGDPEGLAGMQFGIDYTGGLGGNGPLALLDWYPCSDLQFPGDNWPSPGTGNTMTWADCRMTPLVVAGAFYVTAYAPGSMAVVPFPNTGLIKTAGCNGAEMLPDQTLGLDQVGWISMGHAARGLDTDGCNPSMEPCGTQTTAVQAATWGRIKALYGPEAAKGGARN